MIKSTWYLNSQVDLEQKREKDLIQKIIKLTWCLNIDIDPKKERLESIYRKSKLTSDLNILISLEENDEK